MKIRSVFSKCSRIAVTLIAVVMIVGLAAAPAGKLATSASLSSFIVQGTDVDLVAKLVERYGGTVTSQLSIIHGVGALLPTTSVSALLREEAITAITPNSSVQVVEMSSCSGLDVPTTDYPQVVGADVAWEEGTYGEGVTVAVVDTGLGWHPGIYLDMDGGLFDRVVAWKDFVENKKIPQDPNGHGTHVAGIIANSQQDDNGQWAGIAPGVRIVGVRVLDKKGLGTYEKVIQGVQWVINHKNQYHIGVMNLSLVSAVQSPYWADPLNQAIMQAWASGIVVVVAAGNTGPGPMTVGVPGNNPYVITVGAFTDNYTPLDWSDDYITPFSAAGPTLDGFVKPDVVAPGAHITSSMLIASYLARQHTANMLTPFYFSMAGTSQATAVVSGIAAQILSEHPGLTPNEVKYRIMYTAFPWINLETNEALYSMWQQGTGRVNAPDAIFADINGVANYGMDIVADLAGPDHYEGFSYYDQTTGMFRLRGEGYGAWAGGYGAWAGGYGAWAGGYGAWAGGYGAWAGGYGAWAGGYGAWAGGYGAWAGGYGAWAGGYGAWAGGYGAWAGGYGAWAGSEPWAGTTFSDANFVESYLAGESPDASTTTTTVGPWVEEP